MTSVPEFMRFSCLVKKGVSEVRERKIPELTEYDCLIKMKACNICTVDYQQWLGLREHQGYPMAGGHEGTGEIVKVGAKVQDFKPGDRVIVGYQGCGHCAACRQGMTTACKDFRKESEDGYKFGEFGFADYTVKRSDVLYKVNKDLDPSQAAFGEPLADCIRGAKIMHVKPFETIVVIGAGPMGLLNAAAYRAFGARVIVTELIPSKIEMSKKMVFITINSKETDAVQAIKDLTDGVGADAVCVAVANTFAYKQGWEMLKKQGGRFLVFAAGYPAPELDVAANDIHYKEAEILGTYGCTTADFEDAAKALSTGIIDVSPLVEAKYTLDEMQEAYAKAAEPESYRVSIVL